MGIRVDPVALVSEIPDMYFEEQLKELRLDNMSIAGQTLDELKDSLQIVNDALDHPAALGMFLIQAAASFSIADGPGASEVSATFGVGPQLVESKALIQKRIRELGGDAHSIQLENFTGGITFEGGSSAQSAEVLDLIKTLASRLDEAEARLKGQALNQQQTEEKAKLEAFNQQIVLMETQLKQDLAIRDAEANRVRQRFQILREFLERESVATIIGSLLLFVISLAQVAAMVFPALETSEIVNNAFMVLLGYFFGQTVGKPAQRPEPGRGDGEQKQV
jgi:hypothetical protein